MRSARDGAWRASAISARPRRVVATSRGALRAVTAATTADTTPCSGSGRDTPSRERPASRVLSWIGLRTMLG
ncbi:hypothetical protein [Streptomyces sp. ZS0098]|uniref:hypothetical protein n=1 Tax=Streptomyces sp. ZS0098 TaxID=1904044 RepID=UPI00217E442E|nr:hypothetical protein [Streptomyces sp. ZS0098]